MAFTLPSSGSPGSILAGGANAARYYELTQLATSNAWGSPNRASVSGTTPSNTLPPVAVYRTFGERVNGHPTLDPDGDNQGMGTAAVRAAQHNASALTFHRAWWTDTIRIGNLPQKLRYDPKSDSFSLEMEPLPGDPGDAISGNVLLILNQIQSLLTRILGDITKTPALAINNANSDVFRHHPFYDPDSPLSAPTRFILWLSGSQGLKGDAANARSAFFEANNTYAKSFSYTITILGDLLTLKKMCKEIILSGKTSDAKLAKRLKDRGYDLAKAAGDLMMNIGFLYEKYCFIPMRNAVDMALVTGGLAAAGAYALAADWRVTAREASVTAMVGGFLFGLAAIRHEYLKKREALRKGDTAHKENTAMITLGAKLLAESMPRVLSQLVCLASYAWLSAYRNGEDVMAKLRDYPVLGVRLADYFQECLDKLNLTSPDQVTDEMLYLWLKGSYVYPESIATVAFLLAMVGAYAPYKSFNGLRAAVREYSAQDPQTRPPESREKVILESIGLPASVFVFAGGLFAVFPSTDPWAFASFVAGGFLLASQFAYGERAQFPKIAKQIGSALVAVPDKIEALPDRMRVTWADAFVAGYALTHPGQTVRSVLPDGFKASMEAFAARTFDTIRHPWRSLSRVIKK